LPQAQQQYQPSTPKTPLKATLETARERTKSATSALRSTLARNTRPKNENIYNIPNFLTATRLVAAPATAYLLLHDQHTAALLLFAYAGITDLVDGYLARKWNLQTVAGSVMDPMADKALMIIMTATLGIKGLIPSPPSS
jgi:cardiolipin synthase